ncbi:MAG: hypothetical protein H6977_01055 [Gammaproteobacteria bacterium]|nr:hypothetical protein [Gammaproteobacteria bacterium]MCP5198567.1 hypothetical protein [Gammaproteobacteria bacterium]
MIEIEDKGREAGHAVFNVVVSDSAGKTQHRVTLSDETYQRLTGGRITPVACIDAAFRFLLEREAKTDILPSFDLNVIQLYHANFEKEFHNYM